MIRILHVVTYMGRGGLETMLMNYYRNIDRSMVQFDFLVHRDFEADYDAEILSLGGRIFHVSRLIPWSGGYRRELKSFFELHPEYRIVHVHQDCLSSVALECARECGVPVRIAHSHNSNQGKNLKFLLKKHYMKYIPEFATDLFACSQEAGEWMFHTSDFKILKNAIDSEKYMFDLDVKGRICRDLHVVGKVVLGHVGRFRAQKNHLFLIDVFYEFQKLRSDSVLLLVGDGDEEGCVRDRVKQYHLEDKVLFLGSCSNVNELLQAMDVFVFPSLYEGLPVTLVEAQAAGVSCLISDRVPLECKITDLIHVACLEDGPQVWAERVLDLLNEDKKNTYLEICNSGFDIKENAKKLQNYYLEEWGRIE